MYQQQLSEAVAVSRPSGSCGPKVRHSWRLSGGFEGGACSEMPLGFSACGLEESTERVMKIMLAPSIFSLRARVSVSGTLRRAANQHATSPHSRIEQLLRAQGGGERVARAHA